MTSATAVLAITESKINLIMNFKFSRWLIGNPYLISLEDMDVIIKVELLSSD